MPDKRPPVYRHVQLPKSIRLPNGAYAATDHVFHLVIRAMPDTTPFKDPRVAQVTWELIEEQNDRGTVQIYAACFMPDHLHLVVSPRSQDLIRWANSFKSFSTRRSWEFRKATALWQPSFYDRRLRDEAEFEAALIYVEDNPLAAGLVNPGGRWPWVRVW